MENIVCYNCFNEKSNSGACPICGYDDSRDALDHSLALPTGTVLAGKYLVGKVLGQGGFGITYIAQDYTSKQLVALKEFFPDSLATRTDLINVSTIANDRREAFLYGKECFLSEAKTLSEFIGNNNIVRVYNYFEENNTAYFTMEYIKGQSLLSFLDKNGGKICYEEVKDIILPIMDALSYVHSKGVIHRDISPDNIIITDDSEIKLIDFGAARYSLGDKSRSLDVILKHGYAPKEQYTRHGRQGPYTDIYALAATIYRSLTGQIPPDSIDRVDTDTLIPPSALGCVLPAYAENALLKALSPQPSDRFSSMAEFRDACFLSVETDFLSPRILEEQLQTKASQEYIRGVSKEDSQYTKQETTRFRKPKYSKEIFIRNAFLIEGLAALIFVGFLVFIYLLMP